MAIVNSAAMNIGVHVFLNYRFVWIYAQEWDLWIIVIAESPSHGQLFATSWTVAGQSPLSPGVCSNSCPLSRWCYLTISSSATPFSFCLQSFPVSESFLMSQFSASSIQSVGASISAIVFPMNFQESFQWLSLGLLNHMATLFLALWVISIQFSIVSVSIYSPATVWGGALVLLPLQLIGRHFNDGYCDPCETVIHYRFNLHFFNN